MCSTTAGCFGRGLKNYCVSLTIEGTVSHTFFVVSDLFEISEGALLGDKLTTVNLSVHLFYNYFYIIAFIKMQ